MHEALFHSFEYMFVICIANCIVYIENTFHLLFYIFPEPLIGLRIFYEHIHNECYMYLHVNTNCINI